MSNQKGKLDAKNEDNSSNPGIEKGAEKDGNLEQPVPKANSNFNEDAKTEAGGVAINSADANISATTTNVSDVSDKKAETKKGFLQFLKFLGFSIGAGVIEFLSFTVLRLIFTSAQWIVAAEIISVVLSCLFNFTLNRKFTFKQSKNMLFGMLLYGIFYAVTAPLWALAMNAVIRAVGTEYELYVKAVKMLINFVLDFSYCKFIIFGVANKIDFVKVKAACAGFFAKFKKK